MACHSRSSLRIDTVRHEIEHLNHGCTVQVERRRAEIHEVYSHAALRTSPIIVFEHRQHALRCDCLSAGGCSLLSATMARPCLRTLHSESSSIAATEGACCASVSGCSSPREDSARLAHSRCSGSVNVAITQSANRWSVCGSKLRIAAHAVALTAPFVKPGDDRERVLRERRRLLLSHARQCLQAHLPVGRAEHRELSCRCGCTTLSPSACAATHFSPRTCALRVPALCAPRARGWAQQHLQQTPWAWAPTMESAGNVDGSVRIVMAYVECTFPVIKTREFFYKRRDRKKKAGPCRSPSWDRRFVSHVSLAPR